MFQNFLDTQHRTAPRGLFRFCCERCGSKVFALCTTWSVVAGPKVPLWQVAIFSSKPGLGSAVAGLARRARPWVSFNARFCSCVLGIVFSCFFDLHYLVLLCRNGSTSHRHVRGTDGRTSNRYCRPRCLPCPPATGRRTLCPGTPSWGGALLAFLFSVFHHGVANWKPFLEFAHFSPCMQSVTEVNAEGKSEEAVLGQGRRSQTLQIFLYIKILLFIFFPKHNFEDFSPRSRKLAGVTLASARIGRSESNTLIFHSNPPSPGAFWGGLGSRWSRAQILPGL